MKKKSTLTRGFTIVELLVYMGLLSIILIVFTQIFVATIDVQLESKSHSSVEQDGRFLLSRFAYDIKRADAVTIPPSLGGQSNTLQITINSINYNYSINNGNLQILNNTSTDQLNNFDTVISNLNFRREGNIGGKNTISVSFTVTSKVLKRSGGEVKNFQETIGTR